MKLNKILAVVLAVAMILGTMTISVSAAIDWDAEIITINTATELRELAAKVNEGKTFVAQTIILGSDIDLKNEEWTPIGDKVTGKPFSGYFHGENHTISGLKIDSDGTDGREYLALFGLTENATVKDLTVSGSVKGDNVAGIIARMNHSVIENCVSDVNVTAIDNSKAGGIVCLSGGTAYLGSIIKCTNNGKIVQTATMATNNGAAGIISHISSNGGWVYIIDCVNNGKIVSGENGGGIVSYAAANSRFEIDGCINNGEVKSSVAGAGIIAYTGTTTDVKNHTVSNNINNARIIGAKACGIAADFRGGLLINNVNNAELEGDTTADLVGSTMNEVVIAKIMLKNASGVVSYHASIQAAVDAAADGDTITLLPGVISEGAVAVDKAVTIVGAENLGSEITNTQFAIKAPVSFEGLKFTGNSYINISDKNASALTVKNCDVDVDVAKITGRAAFIIATNEDNKSAKVVLKDSIFIVDSPDDYYAGAMFTWSYLADGSEFTGNTFGSEDNRYNFIAVKSLNSANDAVITVSGNKVYGTGEAWYFSAFDLYQNNSRANNYLVISTDNEFDFEEGSYPAKAFYIEANTGSFGSGNALVYDNGSTVNDRELTLEDFEIQADATINAGVDVELDADNKVVYGVFAKAFTDDSYVSPGVETENNDDGSFTITNVEKIADKVTVEFVEGENQGEFDIYVAAVEDDEIINRLKSAALKFSLTEGFGYTLTPADNVTITEDLKEDDAYAFNYDGKGAIEDTAHAIKIASVKVEGIGAYKFSVVSNYDIAKVSATEYSDNIEKTYIPADDTLVLVDDTNNDLAISGEIEEITRELVVKVLFNNEIIEQNEEYTDMKIALVGANGYEDEIALSEANVETVDGVVTATAEFGAVAVPYRYTVTLSGAGYRTATYSNVIGADTTEDTADDVFVLKFWNNVKDAEDYVEAGADRSLMTKNFLAGDIVKDNSINKYDLSAVVSYFGTRQVATSLNKYDLNRDGNIDSEDIAYVLVSFGE